MRYFFLSAAFFSCLVWCRLPAFAEDTITIDQDKIIPNIRKALSIPNEWNMRLERVGPSPIPGMMQSDLEVWLDSANVRNQKVYISEDGRHYIVGNLFDLNTDMDDVRLRSVNLAQSPSKGSEKARVTIVEFSDLQCSSCRSAHIALENDKILDAYKGKVRLVYKNLPLMRYHPWAFQASVGAMCAYRQKPQAFWNVVNEIYLKQGEINVGNVREKLMAIAQAGKLNMPAFQTCFDTQATASDISRDMSEAGSLGITSTPTFLINGRIVVGYPGAASMKRLIEEFLQ